MRRGDEHEGELERLREEHEVTAGRRQRGQRKQGKEGRCKAFTKRPTRGAAGRW